MKAKFNVTIEDINKYENSELIKLIDNYAKARNNFKTIEDYDNLTNLMNEILKLLANVSLIFPLQLDFYDNKFSYSYNKGRVSLDELAESINDKVKILPLKSEVKVGDGTYQKYIIANTKFDSAFNINYVEGALPQLVKNIYEKYLLADSEISGILVDPDTSNFIISKEFCKFITEGCNDLDWDYIVEKAKENFKGNMNK